MSADDDILAQLEPGIYPEASDAELAAISQAVSFRRIADALERMGGGIVPHRDKPAGRVIGKRVGAAPPEKPNIAQGVGIPAEPIPIPPDMMAFGGGMMPVPDGRTDVVVLWRNGQLNEGAAQQFQWKWQGGKAHEVIAWRLVARDPAYTSTPDPALNVPTGTVGGEDE